MTGIPLIERGDARRQKRQLDGVAVAAAVALCLVVGGAAAGEPPQTAGVSERVSRHAFAGIAIAGYDPVAYFADGRAQAGRPDLEWVWNGIPWRFASAANRAAFKASPQVYAPQFGGYDPLGAARGEPVFTDPTVFLILEGRLYLFRSPETRQRFADDPGLRRAAAAGWLRVSEDLIAR